MHSLPHADAVMCGIAFMEQVYPDDTKRNVEWRKLAKAIGIPIDEDPVLKAQRHKEQMERVAAEFGPEG